MDEKFIVSAGQFSCLKGTCLQNYRVKEISIHQQASDFLCQQALAFKTTERMVRTWMRVQCISRIASELQVDNGWS